MVTCDVFISEATVALPAYRWPDTQKVASDIFDWWQANKRAGVASILFAYALGKAQRVLAELMRFTDEPVYVHGAVASLVEAYRQGGVAMLPTLPATVAVRTDYRGALVLAPPAQLGSGGSATLGRAFVRGGCGYAGIGAGEDMVEASCCQITRIGLACCVPFEKPARGESGSP